MENSRRYSRVLSIRRGNHSNSHEVIPMRKMPSAPARMAALCCVVLLVSSVMVQSQSPKNFAQVRREFKTFYEQGMRKNGIVGSSFMLIQDGQVIAQEFFGLANQEKQQQVDENTIYHWASITKTFRITEKTRFELFAGFNNVLNTPRWGFPNTDVFSTTFGVVGAPSGSRTINLRGMLSF